METFYRYTKRRYARRDRPLTVGQKQHIKHLALCLATKKKSDWAYAKKRKWRAAFRKRLVIFRVERRIAAVTPYGPCYGYTWAVPCEIIGGESSTSGLWRAANDGGCVGPYQFCGWSVPWPVMSGTRLEILRKMLAHHEQAEYLWAGGAGCSNWEQTSSQC